MENILLFLKNLPWGDLALIVGAVSLLITAFRGGPFDKAKLEEFMSKLSKKYLCIVEEPEPIIENVDEKGVPDYAQNLKPVYRINRATGELEKTDEVIDIQEVIESCRDVALQSALERLMPVEDTDEVGHRLDMLTDDLNGIAEAMDIAEEYREKFQLDENVSVADIFKRMEVESLNLKKKLAGGEKNEKNEKENVEESK